MTDVRVGIVSWNTAEHLDRCLAAVPAALGDLDAEVVVVDNDSSDDSTTRVARHPWVVLKRNVRNEGYAVAMNQALADTDAEILIALNPDTEPPPGSLAGLVDALRSKPSTGLVVPRLLGSDGRLQHSVHRFPAPSVAAAANLLPTSALRGRLGRRFWFEGAAAHDQSGPVDWAIGAVHVMRRAAVDDMPYSERWFMYVEDLDLCWRLRRDGWVVGLVAEVSVPHVGNVAGAQRWGDQREARYWAATYDWAADALGRGPTRVYAAFNAVGAAVKGATGVAASVLARDRTRLTAARRLLAVVPAHISGVLSPAGEP